MYDFQKNRAKIIAEAKNYGVSIRLVDNGSLHGVLEFASEYRGSESVQKTLQRKINTYNQHSREGH